MTRLADPPVVLGSRRRCLPVISVLAGVTVLAAVATIGLGARGYVAWTDLPAAVIGRGGALADYVVVRTELPRVLVATLCGALLAWAGHLYQRVIRNPLSTPDIVGVSGGASVGAVAVIVGLVDLPVAVAAFIGAVSAVALLFALTDRNAGTYRIVLVGIGLNGATAAVTSWLLTAADEATIEQAMRWLTGSLHGVGWSDARLLAVAAVLTAVALASLERSLTVLGLGDELAAGLGVPVRAIRIGALLLGAAVAAVVTSVVGPLAFVALVCGPVAHRLVPSGPTVLVVPFVGAALVVLADLIAQHGPLFSPVPAGVVTALVGAPVLIRLLLKPMRGTP